MIGSASATVAGPSSTCTKRAPLEIARMGRAGDEQHRADDDHPRSAPVRRRMPPARLRESITYKIREHRKHEEEKRSSAR